MGDGFLADFVQGAALDSPVLRGEAGMACLEESLRAGESMVAVGRAIDELNPAIAQLEQAGGVVIANRIQMEQGKIRLWVA